MQSPVSESECKSEAMVTSPEEEKSEVRCFVVVKIQIQIHKQIQMVTSPEEEKSEVSFL